MAFECLSSSCPGCSTCDPFRPMPKNVTPRAALRAIQNTPGGSYTVRRDAIIVAYIANSPAGWWVNPNGSGRRSSRGRYATPQLAAKAYGLKISEWTEADEAPLGPCAHCGTTKHLRSFVPEQNAILCGYVSKCSERRRERPRPSTASMMEPVERALADRSDSLRPTRIVAELNGPGAA